MQCGNLLRVFSRFFPRGPNDRETDGYKRRYKRYKREGLRGQQMITFPLQHPGTRERRVSIQNEYALTGPQWQTSIMSQSMYRTEITPRSVLHLLVYSEWVYNQYAAVDIGGLLTQQGRRHLYQSRVDHRPGAPERFFDWHSVWQTCVQEADRGS